MFNHLPSDTHCLISLVMMIDEEDEDEEEDFLWAVPRIFSC